MEALPPDLLCLQPLRRWIAWRVGEPRGNGKPGKHPIGADGHGTAWQTPAQWMTHDEARTLVAAQGLAGVGLVLPLQLSADEWLVAMDFDGVPIAATDDPRVQELIEVHAALGCPYAEVSPSGAGVRMLLRARTALPQTRRRRSPNGHFDELFCGNVKWVTVTGRHWRGGGLPESTAALSSLLAEWQRGG